MLRSDPAATATGDRPGSLGVLLALSVVATLVLAFTLKIYVLGPGLDLPFVWAYNHGAASGWRWGRDFLSTYGPFGYLLVPMDVGRNVDQYVGTHLCLTIVYGILAALHVHATPGLGAGARLLAVLALAYAYSVQSLEYHWFALLLLLILLGLHSRGSASLAVYAAAGGLAGFSMLAKLSLGIAAIATLVVSCALLVLPRLVLPRLALAGGAMAASFLVAWRVYNGTFDGIPAYVTTGLDIASGYSSAMSVVSDRWWLGGALFLLWLGLIVWWVARQGTRRSVLSLVVLAFPLWVAWKHAMVRQDGGHIIILTGFGLFVVAVLLPDVLSRSAGWRPWPVVAVLVVLLIVPWLVVPPELREKSGVPLGELLGGPLKLAGLTSLFTLANLPAHRQALASASAAELFPSVLSPRILSLVGRSPVDVYPWDLSYVPVNRLHWVNRPMPASFNAYAPSLDGLNAAFFESDARPTYVIWHAVFGSWARGIDGRYLLWDEPQTVRALLDRYELAASDGPVVLLRARANARLGPPAVGETVSVRWRTWTPVPEASGVLLARTVIGRSIVVRALRAAFREHPIELSLRLGTGEIVEFRVVPDNAGSGLLLHPFVGNREELEALFAGGPTRRVVALHFSAGRLSRLYPPISVTWISLHAAEPR